MIKRVHFSVPSFRKKILQWFSTNKEPLPWRLEQKNLYKVWLSEIMLQQTTRAAVIPKYNAFLKKFPAFESVAKASEEQVLLQCSGLGYYRRFRLFKKACENPQKPLNYETLLEQPGVGPYTAAAVSSIVFGEVKAVVDGNVERVFSRLWKLKVASNDPLLKKSASQVSQTLIDPKEPGLFNEALMELGQTVCTPHSPNCPACPVRTHCLAHKASLQSKIPLPKIKADFIAFQLCVSIPRKAGKLGLIHRDDSYKFLKNSWGFPFEETASFLNPADSFKHTITNHKLTITTQFVTPKAGGIKWFSPSEIESNLLTSLDKKALRHSLKKGR